MEQLPDYFDIRDDRIHFFTTATENGKIFSYQVRVISKGTFTVGPVGADAMYQGEYRSYAGEGRWCRDITGKPQICNLLTCKAFLPLALLLLSENRKQAKVPNIGTFAIFESL